MLQKIMKMEEQMQLKNLHLFIFLQDSIKLILQKNRLNHFFCVIE